MAQELSLDDFSKNMKQLQETGHSSKMVWDPNLLKFVELRPYENAPSDGTPVNFAAEGGFYCIQKS